MLKTQQSGRTYLQRLCLILFLLSAVLPGSPLQRQSTVLKAQALTITQPLQITDSTTTTLTSTEQSTLSPSLQVGSPQVTPTQEEALNSAVETLFQRMSPIDRVGQLFIVTFRGNDTSYDTSGILQLIHTYRIGGVVLSPRNGNFVNEKASNTPRQVASLANRLQAIAYGILLPEERELQPVPVEPWPPPNMTSLKANTGIDPVNLPLLIGVEQIGDAFADTSLRRNFSELPSPLAIGSTWQPALAQQIGEIVGRELRAVGANLLLGPSLDVLVQPRTEHRVGVLGIQSFGGDPFWVSQMGKAYITGVHLGSDSRVATFASHFPGQGDLNRLPEAEVATIHNSDVDLQRVALPPFLAVTTPSLEPTTIPTAEQTPPIVDPVLSDGFMVSHMHFSGLQGSASGHNPPFSLAPELATTLKENGLSAWRAQGGLLMSAPLGITAIRRFYDPALQSFPDRRIARDAFNAGNDLLFLDRFVDLGRSASSDTTNANPAGVTTDSTSDSAESPPIDELGYIRNTIAFFQDEYQKERNFAQQVDERVRRILRLKLRLYVPPASLAKLPRNTTSPQPLIPLSNVLVQTSGLEVFSLEPQEEARTVIRQIARESITRLHPAQPEVLDARRDTPSIHDKLLIFTDSRLLQECDECTAEAALGPDDLAKLIKRFYGADGNGQIVEDHITSLTFQDLEDLLTITRTLTVQAPNVAITSTAPVAPIAGPAAASEPANETEGVVSQQDKLARTEALIAEADWVIFAMLDVDTETEPSSSALKDFLSQRGDQLGNKRVVAFAFGAPYFLDSTDITKLTAYYGVYSRGELFQENAVRTLFGEYQPTGAPSISVDGTPFKSLDQRLQPDADHPLPLQLSNDDRILMSNLNVAAIETTNQADTALKVGDTLHIKVGPILDYNRHMVADGTKVEIEITVNAVNTLLGNTELQTLNGIVSVDLPLTDSGVVQVRARSEDASSGDPFVLTVSGPVLGVQPPPTADGTVVTNAISEFSASLPISNAALSLSPVVEIDDNPLASTKLNMLTLFLALLAIVVVVSVFLLTQIHILPRSIIMRSMCWAIIMGLSTYILYGLQWFPGSTWLAHSLRGMGAPLVGFVGTIIPLLWLQLREVAKPQGIPPTE